ACDAAIAASGTVSLELAVAGTPHIVGYRLNPVTAFLAKRLLRVP
ncbi:MAG TPA: lipid-A-disaccharide synthase, partial [Alphaproteobacteria bacterium]|nr:lipid-A-disaccharide synthase [Alphaproteobacteria bacterium]